MMVGIRKKMIRARRVPNDCGGVRSSRFRYRRTYQSRSASTTTNTGKARTKMTLYSEWTFCPLTSAPCLAQPLRPTASRAAAGANHRLPGRWPRGSRIELWIHREREDHADGCVGRSVVLALWGPLLPAGQEVVPRRKVEHGGFGGTGARVVDFAEVQILRLARAASRAALH